MLSRFIKVVPKTHLPHPRPRTSHTRNMASSPLYIFSFLPPTPDEHRHLRSICGMRRPPPASIIPNEKYIEALGRSLSFVTVRMGVSPCPVATSSSDPNTATVADGASPGSDSARPTATRSPPGGAVERNTFTLSEKKERASNPKHAIPTDADGPSEQVASASKPASVPLPVPVPVQAQAQAQASERPGHGLNPLAQPQSQLVAMGRLTGDSALHIHLLDIAVHPDHRHRGLGGQVVDRLLEWIEGNAPGAYVDLIADTTTATATATAAATPGTVPIVDGGDASVHGGGSAQDCNDAIAAAGPAAASGGAKETRAKGRDPEVDTQHQVGPVEGMYQRRGWVRCGGVGMKRMGVEWLKPAGGTGGSDSCTS